MNHYPHHLGDYAKDTMSLSMLEHGAYRLLLDAYYGSEEAPAADDVYAIAKAGSAAERKAVDKVLRKYFTLREGRYYKGRVEEELAAYRSRADTARVNGRKGGRKPTDNPAGSLMDTKDAAHSEPSGKLASSQEPIPPSLRSGGKARKRAKSSLPEGFGLSERVIDWAKGKGYDNLAAHLDAFRLKAVANDYRYADWDHALMNAIEADWAGLRRKGAKSELRGEDAIASAMRITAEKEGRNAPH